MKRAVLFVICVVMASVAMAQTPLWQGVGRIAISSDGNEHDDDDWAATPMSLAILASQGLQDHLVLYTFSDHVWGSNKNYPNVNGLSAYEHMLVSALGGGQRFGFASSTFICAVDDPDAAYRAMAEQINASSSADPLFIIAAGPMHVVGEGLRLAKKSKRKYVSVISHSNWNNTHSDNPNKNENHSGWTFDAMQESFGSSEGGGAKFIRIADQNGGDGYEGLKALRAQYDWLLESPARNNPPYQRGSWEWLHSRLELCPKPKNSGKFFDASDAGMVLFLVTGEEQTSTALLREVLENPVK